MSRNIGNEPFILCRVMLSFTAATRIFLEALYKKEEKQYLCMIFNTKTSYSCADLYMILNNVLYIMSVAFSLIFFSK